MILGKLKSYALAAGAGIVALLLFLLRMRGRKLERSRRADAEAETTKKWRERAIGEADMEADEEIGRLSEKLGGDDD